MDKQYITSQEAAGILGMRLRTFYEQSFAMNWPCRTIQGHGRGLFFELAFIERVKLNMRIEERNERRRLRLEEYARRQKRSEQRVKELLAAKKVDGRFQKRKRRPVGKLKFEPLHTEWPLCNFSDVTSEKR